MWMVLSLLNNWVENVNNNQMKKDMDDYVTWSAYKWLIPVYDVYFN